jgi:hypothetical protein
MLKRVLVVVTGAAGGGRAYSQYMSRVMPVSGASHRTFSASTPESAGHPPADSRFLWRVWIKWLSLEE